MPRPLFEADLLAPGRHLSRINGFLDAPAPRLQRYVDQFRRMRAAGIKVPLYWGHQMTPERYGPDRQPDPHPDDQATEKARWKAGHIRDLSINPKSGRLRMTATAPPGMRVDPETRELVDPVRHTCIDEVSAGIGDWRDGAGRWWDDAVVHVALTPLPAWVWQDGFRPAGADGLIALGDARTRVRYVLGGTMPATMKKPGQDEEEDTPPEAAEEAPPEEAPPEEEAAAPEGAPPTGDPAAATEGSPADPMAEAEEPTGGEPELGDMPGDPEAEAAEAADGAGDPEIDALVDQLGQLGVPGLEGMNAENVVAMLSGVIGGLLAAGAKISVGSEHDLQPGDKPQAESPPMFMLSAGEPTPSGFTEREWKMARTTATRGKDDLRKRCDRAVEMGMPADIVGEIRERATRFTLSADGEVAFPDVEHDLALTERYAERVAPLLKAALSAQDPACKDQPNPARGGDADPKDPEYAAWLEAQAERMYGKGAKPKVIE